VSDVDIANEFAAYFKQVFHSSDDQQAYNEYMCKREECINENMCSGYKCIESVTVELLDKCMRKLNLGKACGPDDLCAEHLLYSHPILLMHLQTLFKLILCHRYVPNSFGIGVTVPLIKDKAGSVNDVSNYRGITLSPVISKLFEVVIMSLCSDTLQTDSLQFGFKDKIGTADAIFTMKSTIKHFTDRGSSVYIASLDIRKAFDRVSHFKLYKSLLDARVPVIIVDVLSNWYSKLYYAVRWNSALSAQFAVFSGVRQGSCISPAIFNVFMNVFIKQLKQLGVGCHISSLFLGCILYADDLLLLSPSVIGLQSMLDKCFEVGKVLSLEFNAEKSHCITIGKKSACDITPMNLYDNRVEWCESIKYLGVYLQRGTSVKFDINPSKRVFYAACNTIFLHSSGVDEISLLNLQETFSLCVIMYAMPALCLTTRQISELNACWNNVIRRLFGFNKWESVSAVLLGLGRLNISHLIMLRKVRFYRHLLHSCDMFLCNVFLMFFLDNFKSDCVLRTLFLSTTEATRSIWNAFENYVTV